MSAITKRGAQRRRQCWRSSAKGDLSRVKTLLTAVIQELISPSNKPCEFCLWRRSIKSWPKSAHRALRRASKLRPAVARQGKCPGQNFFQEFFVFCCPFGSGEIKRRTSRYQIVWRWMFWRDRDYFSQAHERVRFFSLLSILVCEKNLLARIAARR